MNKNMTKNREPFKNSPRSLIKNIYLIIVIIFKLTIITAMLNRNISEFIYRGF